MIETRMHEELLALFKGNTTNIKTYLDYISNHGSKEKLSTEYSEHHHIVPEQWCIDLAKEKANMIYLTAYHHFVAHYLLSFSRNKEMLFALNNMNRIKTLNIRRKDVNITEEQLDAMARMYEEFRIELRDAFQLLNTGRKHSEKTRSAQQNRLRGKLYVVEKSSGLNVFITSDEYRENKEKYQHHCIGRKHKEETKKLQRDKSNRGKKAFTKPCGAVYYDDAAQNSGDAVLGNPKQANIAKERFTGMLHWTNQITGETARSKESPGDNWEQRRTGFNNFYSNNYIMINLFTQEVEKIARENRQPHHVTQNTLIYVLDDMVTKKCELLAEILNLHPTMVKLAFDRATTEPNRKITRAAVRTLGEQDKEKYGFWVGKTYGDIFTGKKIQKILAKDYRPNKSHALIV